MDFDSIIRRFDPFHSKFTHMDATKIQYIEQKYKKYDEFIFIITKPLSLNFYKYLYLFLFERYKLNIDLYFSILDNNNKYFSFFKKNMLLTSFTELNFSNFMNTNVQKLQNQ